MSSGKYLKQHTPKLLISGVVSAVALLSVVAAGRPLFGFDAAHASDRDNRGTTISGSGNNVGVSTGQTGGQTAGTINNGPVYNGPVTNQSINRATVLISDRMRKLIPGHDKTTANYCGDKPPKGALLVLFGKGAAWWKGNGPMTVLTYGGVPIIVLRREGKSIVIDTLRIYDDRADIIVRGSPNGFWKSPSTRVENPDRSTLVAFDHADNEVLKIRFINRSAVSIQGIFRTPNMPPSNYIVATPDGIVQMPNKNVFGTFCSGGASGIFRL